MKKTPRNRSLEVFVISCGRSTRIRTLDPLVPNQVRYQTAPHSDKSQIIYIKIGPHHFIKKIYAALKSELAAYQQHWRAAV